MSPRRLLPDSSVWIEILGQGPLLKACHRELGSAGVVIVPTLVLFEVYRKIAQSTSEDKALSAIALLTQHTVSELTQEIALTAADLSLQNGLTMADSMVLAHAQLSQSLLITLDNDFSKIAGAKVLRKN